MPRVSLLGNSENSASGRGLNTSPTRLTTHNLPTLNVFIRTYALPNGVPQPGPYHLGPKPNMVTSCIQHGGTRSA